MLLDPLGRVIAAGVGGILSAHVSFPDIEPSGLPATLSQRVQTALLRTELGFDGMIFTDSIEMGALTSSGYPPELASAMAIRAGADMVLFNTTSDVVRAAHTQLQHWLATQQLAGARLMDAAAYVAAAKARFNMMRAFA